MRSFPLLTFGGLWLLLSGCSNGTDPPAGQGLTLGAGADGAGATGGDGVGASSTGATGQGGDAGGSAGIGGGGAGSSGEIVFFDDFEYQVDRGVPGATGIFQAHGWNAVKSEEEVGGGGYLYTVTAIEGAAGGFPAPGSTRALALEARPTMYPPPQGFPVQQTDFWLQLGAENGPLGTVPADLWIQFWIYLAHTEDQPSAFPARNKFFYPSASDPAYPSSDERWLFMNGSRGFETVEGNPEDNYLCMRPPQAVRLDADPGDADKLGQNVSSKQILANDWYLVRMHIDTSQPQGRWEAWIRTQSETSLTKIAEWIGDETPNFNWPLTPEQRTGLRVLRIPTTVNEFDSWMYMDDLYLTTGEGALPYD